MNAALGRRAVELVPVCGEGAFSEQPYQIALRERNVAGEHEPKPQILPGQECRRAADGLQPLIGRDVIVDESNDVALFRP